MQPNEQNLPAAVLAEAMEGLPGDVEGFHAALQLAADAHDPIRMDHLVQGWAMARAELTVENDREGAMWAGLDRRLGQVLFGGGHPAAGEVLADALAHAAASGDVVEELRCRLALVPVEIVVGDESAFAAGLGYVDQLQAMGENGHAAGGLMGLAQAAPPQEAPSLVLQASHLYERDGDSGWAAQAAVLATRAMVAAGDSRAEDAMARARTLVDAHPTVELMIELALVEAVVLWHRGDAPAAAMVLGEAVEAAERTGRPVPPDLRVMLCDIFVETQQWQALVAPAQGLADMGRLVGDDELTSVGERYLALARSYQG